MKKLRNSHPKVSVWMISYNHEEYIAKAIESVLSQVTNFQFELVIGEDSSSDRTAEIIKSYQIKNPNIIGRVRFNKNNMGMMPNMIQTLNECKGDYIALLEGDDYWLDTSKLQTQVDYLESHTKASMCFTYQLEVTKEGIPIKENHYTLKTYETHDVLKGFIPPTQTILIRKNEGLTAFLKKHIDSPSGDRMLTYFYSLIGEIHVIPKISGAYRQSGSGVWNSYSDNQKFFLNLNGFIEFHLSIGLPANNEYIHQRINGSIIYLLTKDLKTSLRNIKNTLQIKRKHKINSHFMFYLISKLNN